MTLHSIWTDQAQAIEMDLLTPNKYSYEQVLRGFPMSIRKAIVPIVMSSLLFAACSSGSTGSSSPETSSSSGSSGTTNNVKPYLLTVSDLTGTWSVLSGGEPLSGTCLARPLKTANAASYGVIQFVNGGSGAGSALGQELGSYASGSTAFNQVKSTIQRCPSVDVVTQGITVHYAITPVSAPTYGNQSYAYSATASLSGVTVSVGFFLVQKGNFVTLLVQGGAGPYDPAELEHYVTVALAKIPN